ncbi:phage portal protein family protein [Malaciobacter marinus]|uniref:phage portal protein family protein n=1 Tax=Malaciobacter marinus TaxID=505249 RepID=UPI003AFF8218
MLKWFNKTKEKKQKDKRENIKLTTEHKDILKAIFELPVQESWLSEDTIEKILRDGTVESSIGSRKAATLKKEINISCKNEEIKKELESVFDYDTLDCILDTPYYGFNVFEINWNYKNSYWYPILEDRDYKDFILDNKQLKFYGNSFIEEIPPYKALYTTYRAKAKKPYGKPILNTLFWLIEFKNASLEFWVELLEKFGTPWVIGKTEGNKDDFADEIYNMLGGDGAVIDSEDSIEVITAKDKGDYKLLIEYIDDQIRQLILGGNLTSNVKGGSQAAATVHNEIREDLAKADENIVNKVIKELINNFKELNQINEEITGQLKDKDDPNKPLADRDKVIYDMGYKPTQEYIENTYNIKVEEIKKEDNPIPNNNILKANNLLSMNKTKLASDELDYQANSIDLSNSLTFQEQIIKTLNKANSFEEAFSLLSNIYSEVNTDDLEENLKRVLANTSILATAQVEEENQDG